MHKQQGFSLIELMISMVISLFILGGVAASFTSNSRTSEVKRGYDQAQDSFRFAAAALPRVIRQATELGVDTSEQLLALRYPGGDTVLDCLGQPTEEGSVHEDRLWVEAGQLWCNDVALADGFAQVTFRYGVAPDRRTALGAEYQAELTGAERAAARSVRVELRMQNGIHTSLTTAIRSRVLGLSGV